VSVGVSRTGKTSVVFVELGPRSTVSITGEKVFGQGLLPDIRVRCGH